MDEDEEGLYDPSAKEDEAGFSGLVADEQTEGKAEQSQLDGLAQDNPMQAADLYRMGLKRQISEDDPIWEAAALLRAGREDFEKQVEGLRDLLAGHLAAEARQSNELSQKAASEISLALASKATDILDAGQTMAAAVINAEKRAAAALDKAAEAKGEHISQKWADAAAEAIALRVGAQVTRMNALSFSVTGAVLLVFSVVGAGAMYAGLSAEHRIAPRPIKSCVLNSDRYHPYCLVGK